MDRLTADAAQEVLTFTSLTHSCAQQGGGGAVAGRGERHLVLMQGLHGCHRRSQTLHYTGFTVHCTVCAIFVQSQVNTPLGEMCPSLLVLSSKLK